MNALNGDLIDIHLHLSQNFEDTYTDTRTIRQQNSVEIESSYGSDSEISAVGGTSQEGTADKDDEG